MVLAIGIVVDDAIVVIENVERIMTEEGLSPKEATRKAMGQITGAVIAITVVLAAVFIPSALQGGSGRRDLQAVRAHHRDGDGVLGVPRAGLHARRCARACSSRREHHEARNFDLPRLQQVLRQGRATPTSATSAARCTHAPRWMIVFVVAGGAVRLPVHAHAGQLPARGRPGLRARDRAAAAGRDAAAARNAVFDQMRRRCSRSRKASTA